MDDGELSFFDVATYTILFFGQIANFGLSIQLLSVPNVQRVCPVQINWCLTVIFGISAIVYVVIQVGLIVHKNNKQQIKIWNQYDLNNMEASISLYFIAFIELFSELIVAFDNLTGYDEAQLLQVLIFLRVIITCVLFMFSYYIYNKRLDRIIVSQLITPLV